MRRTTFAFLLSGAILAVPVPAAADSPSFTLVYSAPELSEDISEVTWAWTVTNTGKAAAGNVVVRHTLEPVGAEILSVGDMCSPPTNRGVTCNLGTLAAGGHHDGTLVVKLPPEARKAAISGTVTGVGQPTTPAWRSPQPACADGPVQAVGGW
ncbi:hypothetical protein H9Y04_24810 [Streptomyces sp. TRM66268-LWL]|uniref:DUF11 domain-containing protein n=1 Tax=Streptomyces polyasparticus TaxID=2767826 RepID=A0ABR7SMF2_9ACTN|nr:DUF11 domain-containing protein [Streptomyces polyasparticus]MBC9715767.1 hypothetical protein [Streptomyces polyasparticus]